MGKIKFTRGNGVAEDVLMKLRVKAADRLIPNHCRDGRILDIGCGTIPFFLMNINFKEKYGIDKNLSIKNINGIIIKKKDITMNIPYEDEYFDVVTMLATVEHFSEEEVTRIFREIFRVLKRNGILIITTPTPIGFYVLKIMAYFNIVSKEEIFEHKLIASKEKVISILKRSNYIYKRKEHGFFEFCLNSWFCITK